MSFDLEQWIVGKRSLTEVSAKWRPVLLYRNGCAVGMGSMFLDGDWKRRIITAKHIFGQSNEACEWSFRLMWPFRDYREPITGAFSITGSEDWDLAVCMPGENVVSIPGIWEEAAIERTFRATIGLLGTPVMITSLLSGEEIACVGTCTEPGKEYFLSAFPTRDGESGSGFLDRDGRLYVLKGCSEMAEDVRRILRLPESVKTLSCFMNTQFKG